MQRCAQCEAERNRASQKQRSEFLAALFHKAPPGRQKSEREFCLFGGVFLRPVRRAMWRADRFCAACRSCGGFCAWPALFTRSVLCVRGFSLLFFSPFSVSLLPLKSLFTCRSGRDGPLLSSEKKVDKDSQKGFAPLNPIPAPCGRSFLLPRCWPAYAAFQAANRRLTGKRLKSQGAELSFSSVSVRRGTPAPFRRSPPFSRCWPA